jgi:hypothetical protein
VARPEAYSKLARGGFLTDVYSRVHDLLNEFESQGTTRSLVEAAAALCGGLAQIEMDDEFWHGFYDVASLPPSDHGEAATIVRDLDTLITLETDILVRLGLPRDKAADLGRDVALAGIGYDEWPDEYAVAEVHRAVESARRAACLRASRDELVGSRLSGFPSVRRAFRVAGGMTVISANAAALTGTLGDTSPEAISSIPLGTKYVRDAVRPAR